MQLKIVLNDKRKSLAPTILSSPTSCLFETSDADTALVSELQKHCASEFKIPVESVRLVHWKGYSICSGSRIKFKTLTEAGLEDRDRLTLVRLAPTVSSPIAPTIQNLCGPPVRLQRRSLQIDDGKVCLVTEERFYEKPSIPAAVQSIYKSPLASLPIILKRNETPHDQHCLYRCISQLLFRGEQSTVAIRWLCTNALTKRPEVFTPDILRTTVQDYGKKILNPNSYGGYIELSLIALEYNVGLAAWHTRNQRLDVYGEDFERSRGRHYLIYDGVHYDWVSGFDPLTKREYRLFSADDQNVLTQVKELGSRVSATAPSMTQQGPITRQIVSGGSKITTQATTIAGPTIVTSRKVATTPSITSTHAVCSGKQVLPSQPLSSVQQMPTKQHVISTRPTTPLQQPSSSPVISGKPATSARQSPSQVSTASVSPQSVMTRPASPSSRPTSSSQTSTAEDTVSTRPTYSSSPQNVTVKSSSPEQVVSEVVKGAVSTQQIPLDKGSPTVAATAPKPPQSIVPSSSPVAQTMLKPPTSHRPSSQSLPVPIPRRIVTTSPKATAVDARPIDTPEKSRLAGLGRTTPTATSKKSLPLPTSSQ